MTSSYDLYQIRLNIEGDAKKDRQVFKLKKAITKSFFSSPSYYSVVQYSPLSPYTPTTLDSWITDDSKTKDLMQIQLIPDQILNYGDLILWKNDYWLTKIIDFKGDTEYTGSISKCYSSLKWLDVNGAIKETYFTFSTTSTKGLGIAEDKIMILPNERRYIAIQNNADTIKIVKNQRFILDNGRCWRAVNLDTMLTGIIEITLEETELSLELDSVNLRIANCYLHNYTIDITNGASVNLSIGNALQLNVVTKDNGSIASLPVTYASLDATIATVSSLGNITCIANGTVTVKATLTSNPTIFSTISVVVSTVVTPINSISISGVNSIKVTQTQTTSGTVMVNGITDGSKTISWSLFASNGVDSTTLAMIMSQTGTNVVIKANSVSPYRYGDVLLKAFCVQDGTIVGTKVVHIVSLI